jgi:proteasome accessory factor A
LTLQLVTRVVTAPLAGGLYVLLRATAFNRLRRELLPFLVTRTVLAGAGMIDRQGRFQLSDKGPAINCEMGFGGLCGDRPIFTMGHFLKAIYAEAWFSPRGYGRLFASRQRMQIGLGDSNMCEAAEYLRVGTTMLVLDAIESGALEGSPQLCRPIRSLHAICRDVVLKGPVALRGRPAASALEIQHYYYRACRAFVARQADAPDEAWEILALWKQTLDRLEEMAGTGRAPDSLIGTLDWVTKRHLVEQAVGDGTWRERKKVDIRYHELSGEGYFEMLRRVGATARIVSDDELERAQRIPPPNSPATARGHFIREFSHGDQPLTVNWHSVRIGSGRKARVVSLAGRGTARSGDSPPKHITTPRHDSGQR